MEIPMVPSEEILSLVHTVQQIWGYDFSEYAQASLFRRVQRCAALAGISIPELEQRLATNRAVFDWFLEHLTVNVTEMFRDPDFYRLLREQVLPVLETYPRIHIWHAGCSTGEEVYSLAILLQEQGLLSRCQIFATDLNPGNLQKARKGIISAASIREYVQNYRQSGGVEDFSHYYTARYGHAIIRKDLRERVMFLPHNLVADGWFHEFHLVLCRNVLIYFNRALQEKVLNLLAKSLAPLGYLALGTKETLALSPVAALFEPIDSQLKVFRKKVRPSAPAPLWKNLL